MLASKGVFQQIDSSYLIPDSEVKSAQEWRERYSQYYELERRLISAMKLLDLNEGQLQESTRTSLAELKEIRPEAEHLEQQVTELQDRLNETQKRIDKLQGYLLQLEPVADLDIPLESLLDSRYVLAMFGLMPLVNLKRIKVSLSKIPFVLLDLKHIDEHAVVLLLGTKKNAEIINRAARSAYLNPLSVPEGYPGTPREIIEKITDEVAQLKEQYQSLLAQKEQLRTSIKRKMRDILWQVRVSRMLADTITHYGKLNYTYIIVGWVISEQVQSVVQQLKEISGDILVETKAVKQTKPGNGAPVALKNPGLFGAFEALVTTYGIPAYKEIDPTVLFTFTFPLLFGAMFGDVGHGLVLALAGAFLIWKKGNMAKSGKVVLASGLVAVVFGFLYGSIFGVEHFLPALWLHPMEHIMDILIVTIIGGVVLLSLAYIISLINAARMRNWPHFIFANTGLAGLLMYWSLLGFVAKIMGVNVPVPNAVFLTIAAISALMIVAYEPVTRIVEKKSPVIEDGITMFMIQAFFELFETVISFLSNSLSYVRVGAFAVAHAGLSAVIFILADMVGTTASPLYWLVLALGNLFIIGFEGMIVGIQTLRLEYYEFFSKFFTGGGNRYSPVHLSNS